MIFLFGPFVSISFLATKDSHPDGHRDEHNSEQSHRREHAARHYGPENTERCHASSGENDRAFRRYALDAILTGRHELRPISIPPPIEPVQFRIALEFLHVSHERIGGLLDLVEQFGRIDTAAMMNRQPRVAVRACHILR